MFDTHAHLDQPEFSHDLEGVICTSREHGVRRILCVGTTASSSAAVVRMAEQNTAIHAAVGVQPNYTGDVTAEDWDQVVELASRSVVAAIGETGLDRYWDYAPFGTQQEYFDRHLRLSQRCGLPVVIHCREAEADLIPMLREAAGRGPISGVLHSFSGDAAFAEQCLDLGLYVSFSGMVTYKNKKFRALRDVAAMIPEERLLVETDSPYLVPHPLRGKQSRNEPANLRWIVQALAELRETDVDSIIATTTANANRLFALQISDTPPN